MILVLTLVPVVVIDLEHKLIPDVFVLPAAAAALALAIAESPDRWWVPVVGALGASLFLLILSLVYPGGMGLGDVKLALLLGAVLGVSVVPALAVAFFAGALLGAVLLVRMGASARKMAVPFGPFLAAGALVALWFGSSMIDWYSGRF
jgi:prepilin signal peptidase PulO-like enzyme (type II secretory pathway)